MAVLDRLLVEEELPEEVIVLVPVTVPVAKAVRVAVVVPVETGVPRAEGDSVLDRVGLVVSRGVLSSDLEAVAVPLVVVDLLPVAVRLGVRVFEVVEVKEFVANPEFVVV